MHELVDSNQGSIRLVIMLKQIDQTPLNRIKL